MGRVVHFEIHAEDPTRAARFYEALFGWKIVKWDGPMEYWMIHTGEASEHGIDGGMVRRRGAIDGTAVIAFVCTVDVSSIDDSLAQAQSLGAQIAIPRMPIPGVGWLAYIKDTEGNILGLMQNDAAAGT